MLAAMKQSQWTVSQSTHAVCGLMQTKLPASMPTSAVTGKSALGSSAPIQGYPGLCAAALTPWMGLALAM